MKNLELNNLGVQEMNTTEMTKVEGGGILGSALTSILGTVTGTANSVLNDTFSFLGKQLNTVLKAVWSL